MKQTISGKYLAILALAAAAILFVGGRYRPRGAEPAAPSPTETAMLQQSVRRDQAAGIGQYLESRAAELADQVVFLPSNGTSGVRYQSPTQVLTVDGAGELLEPALLVTEIPSPQTPALTGELQRNPDNWILVIGRTPTDEPLWTAVIQGVTEPARCNEVSYRKLVLNVTLDKSFTGAGAFDLDGRLVGIAMPCDGTLHIVSIDSVPELLAKTSDPERAFVEKFGFRTAPLPPEWQDLYPRMKGLIVTDVWLGRWADRNGLLPGDLILTEEPALKTTNIGTELKIVRAGRPGVMRAQVDAADNEAGIAIVPPPSPLPQLLIDHGSAAERAGLRSGDRLVSIVGQRNSSLSSLSKSLATPDGNPVRIVYERGEKRGLVEVTP